MVRTKKHFRPPSSSSSSSESDDEDYNVQAAASRGRGKQLGNYGGGKQLSMARQGGKQLSMNPPDDDSSDDDDDDAPIPSSGGKQIRPRGMGKQLRAPSPQRDDDDDDSDSSDDSVPHVPVGSGKRLGMAGGGKQLRRQSANVEEAEDDSSDDDSDDDAPWEVAAANRGQGKMLRPSPNTKKKEESDMDESSEEEEEEEEEEVKKPASAAATKPPIFDDSDESEPEPAPKRRGRPPRAAATRASARTKTVNKKALSDSSDSDDSSSEEELELDFETFDTQKLVQNEDDKKYLDSLPELEREAILAERFDELKKQADIKKALRENKRREREAKKAAEGGKKKKKTTAAAKKKKAAAAKSKKAPPKKKQKVADEEEEDSSEEEEVLDTSADAAIAASLSGKRVSARNLVKKGKQFKKQAALAKIRESRANKKVEEESDSELDYGRDSDDSDSDFEETLKPWQKKAAKNKATTQLQAAESSDESMVDVDEEEKDEPVKRTEDVEADQEDYAKVFVPRRRLIRWCNEPYFLDAIKNFYVRIGIGRDNKTQKACYRLCKIDGIVEKDAYTFPASKGQQAVTTDKWLTVSFGKQKREFKMLTASDHRPTVDDVAKYVGHLKNERGTLLTKKRANKLRKKQDELVNNYTYTKEDIEMLVKEKKKRNKKSANIGLEKTRMAIAVRAAEDAVKEIERQIEDAEVARMEADGESNEKAADKMVEELKNALEVANNNLIEVKAEQDRILKEDEERSNKLKQNSKIQNWDRVNQRAKLANQNADFAAYKEQQRAKAQAEGSAEPKFDPYARRKVKPKNLWEVKGAKTEEPVEATVEEEKKEAGALVEGDDSNVTKEVDKENKREDNPDPQKNDVPAQSNQFAFDDDIIGGDIANLAGIGVKKATTRIRKGISLEDYQSRKAAGTL